MRREFLLILITLSALAQELHGSSVDWYFFAHSDDVILFMGLHLYEDLGAGNDVRLVCVTATDAGTGNSSWSLGQKHALQESVKSILDRRSGESQGTVDINGHSIQFWREDMVQIYFLRLPDGNVDGEGWPGADRNQSLKKLRSGKIDSLTAVDNSTIYFGWADLVETIRALVVLEGSADKNLWANIQETENNFEGRDLNPGDHSDHTEFSRAVQEAISIIPFFNRRFFVGYDTWMRPANLNEEDYRVKSALFDIMVWDLGLTQRPSDQYNDWLRREYFREKPYRTGRRTRR